MRPSRAAPILIALLVLAFPAGAATDFHAIIDGSQANPPNNSRARGVGRFVLDDAQATLAYDIEFSPFVHEEIVSHIHRDATDGAPAEPVHDLEPGPHKVGVMKLTPDLAKALLEGHLYVNVHSPTQVNGEIAGYIVPGTPTAAAASTWGRIKALFR